MNNKVRVGVFFCHCNGLVTDKVDYDHLMGQIKRLPEVEYVRESQRVCAFLEGELMAKEIKRNKLNRILVVGCSEPKTEKFFKNVLEKAGLNANLLVMVNLREHCSFVHFKNKKTTAKALEMIKMGIARVCEAKPISQQAFQVNRKVLVIGGGMAGMEGALQCALKGFRVILIERENHLGGLINRLNSVFGLEDHPTELIKNKMADIQANSNIEVYTSTRLIDLEGSIGKFTAYLASEGQIIPLKIGAIIVATGLQTVFCPVKYNLGITENVIGLLRLEQMLARNKDFEEKVISFVVGKTSEKYDLPFLIVLKNAVYMKKKFNTSINIFYSNMKVSGAGWEELYLEARDLGVAFFKIENKIDITLNNSQVDICYEEPFLKHKLPANYKLTSDIVVLPEELVPAEGAAELAKALKISQGPESFFGSNNVHYLSEFTARDGLYLVGGCQFPCFLPQLFIQAQVIAGEITKKLGRSAELFVEQTYPTVDVTKCAACMTCYRSCPHKAIAIEHNLKFNNLYHSVAVINPLACRQCGTCAAECPGKAIEFPLGTDRQILAQLEAMEG